MVLTTAHHDRDQLEYSTVRAFTRIACLTIVLCHVVMTIGAQSNRVTRVSQTSHDTLDTTPHDHASDDGSVPMTLAAVLTLKEIGDIDLSADGHDVLFTVKTSDSATNRVDSSLWTAATDGASGAREWLRWPGLARRPARGGRPSRSSHRVPWRC